jgi:hypothetical protein
MSQILPTECLLYRFDEQLQGSDKHVDKYESLVETCLQSLIGSKDASQLMQFARRLVALDQEDMTRYNIRRL